MTEQLRVLEWVRYFSRGGRTFNVEGWTRGMNYYLGFVLCSRHVIFFIPHNSP